MAATDGGRAEAGGGAARAGTHGVMTTEGSFHPQNHLDHEGAEQILPLPLARALTAINTRHDEQ